MSNCQSTFEPFPTCSDGLVIFLLEIMIDGSARKNICISIVMYLFVMNIQYLNECIAHFLQSYNTRQICINLTLSHIWPWKEDQRSKLISTVDSMTMISYMLLIHTESLKAILKEIYHALYNLTFKVTDDLERKVIGEN